MLKTVMFASALAISAPALAQDMAPTPDSQQQTQQTVKSDKKSKRDKTSVPAEASTTTATAPTDAAATATATPPTGDVSADAATTAQTAPAAPATGDPATSAAPAQSASTTPAPAQPAAGTPAAGKTQIAQVINTEFPSYDKNTDGNLDKAEFGSWMVALKTASDPATNATAPETTQWVAGAFAQADKDKSAAVSKDELTSFLTQGAE